MKLFLSIILASCIATLACAEKVQVITHVNIIPMTTETVLKNQTVIIENGMITRVGDAGKIKVPANASVIVSRHTPHWKRLLKTLRLTWVC